MNILLILFFLFVTSSNENILTIATTTSLDDTGILNALMPPFEQQYNIQVKYIAVGTGQALRLARDGNVDLVFVHDKEKEEEFTKQGFGIKRYEVMNNYFFIVGPHKHKESLRNKSLCEVLKSIESNAYPFVSRGDDSGTHSREKSLWEKCKISNFGKWYIETGSGMISTLRIANEKQAFTLTDSSTYLSHQKELQLIPYIKKDALLLNIYSLIPVNPEKYPHVQLKNAEKFINYILRGKGKEIIKNFGKEKFGKPLFNLIDKQ